MAPVKRGFSQKILRPNPALVGRVAEVLRFAAHCPDTHIADTQRPLPYCLTATEMKKSPQLSELL